MHPTRLAANAPSCAVMEQAQRAGAAIINAAENSFWGGYAGYFQDPEHPHMVIAKKDQF